MSSQIRRSAASIPANVAEGYARAKRGEYVHFLYIAQGSLKELETHLILAVRVGLAPEADVSNILSVCDEEGKMLAAQIRRLQSPDGTAS